MEGDTPIADSEDQIIDDPAFPPTRHLELLYAEVKGRLEAQRYELDDLQRVVAIVLTAAGVVLGFAGSQFPTSHTPYTKFVLFVAAVIALALDLAVGVAALWPRGTKITAEPGPLVDEYTSAPTNVMLYDLVSAARSAYDKNESDGIGLTRSRLVRAQLLLLGAGAVLLGTGILAPHV